MKNECLCQIEFKDFVFLRHYAVSNSSHKRPIDPDNGIMFGFYFPVIDILVSDMPYDEALVLSLVKSLRVKSYPELLVLIDDHAQFCNLV